MAARAHALALALALALVGGELGCSPGDEAAEADVAQQSREPAATRFSDEDCQACHEQAAEQWASSRHHGAFTNVDFARAYARETRDFCRDCHAPARVRPARLKLADDAAETLGVGCIDCHVDPGEPELVHTGPERSEGLVRPSPPHDLRRELEFGTRSCARCHEFGFPATSRRPQGTMMQLTMAEHRASAHAERSCASCHMPAGAHDLGSSRDDEAIRAALSIRASGSPTELLVELAPLGVGHAFPTGDLYRRVAIHAELRTSAGQVRGHATRYLARQFTPWRFADGRRNPAWREPVPDERIYGPTRVELSLDFDPRDPEPRQREGETLAWWVDYERVDARDDLDPSQSTIASSVRLAEGWL